MLTTLEFLRLTLPEEGAHFVSLHSGSGWHDSFAGYDLEDVAQFIESNAARDANVYYAAASFHSWAAGRKASNARSLRQFRLDIDVGKKANSYPSRDAAAQALRAFIPHFLAPNLLVDSGRGFHVYWLLDDSIPVETWLPLAERLKSLTQAHGLIADPAITADAARVLRPVGTWWRKAGQDPRPVTARFWDRKTYPVARIEAALETARDAPHAPRTRTRGQTPPVGMNAALETVVAYEKADHTLIAESGCGQVRRFMESGDVSYPVWYQLAGLFHRVKDGDDWFHHYSAQGYPGYDRAEAQFKLDEWRKTHNRGASRCATFREADPAGPCARCTLSCNSPWSLGLGRRGSDPVPDTRSPTGEFRAKAWPEGQARVIDGALEFLCYNRETRSHEFRAIANLPFYLESIAHKPDGSLESDVVVFRRPGERSEFLLDHGLIKDPRALSRLLTSRGIFGDPKLLGDYIVAYLESLKKTIDDTPTHRQMGWIAPDKFLIGDTVVTPTGTTPVRTNANLAHKATLYDASKPAAAWAEAVDALYHCANGQPYQFVIAAAFGSALVPVLDAEEYNGIPIGITSDESGYGKSTVAKIALAAFGRVDRNLNVLTGDEVSVGAVEVQCSTFNSVPHLFDEMTNKSGPETSHILYMLSNGVARARLRQDGTPRPANPPWRGLSFITGNRNIFQRLTESKVNPEAAQLRVFEIPLENYPRLESLTHPADFIALTNSVRSGYGQVGEQFLRFVMAHRRKIHDALWQEVDRLSQAAGVRHDKERFYVYTVACALVAARILKHLGLIQFSIKRIQDWAVLHMSTLRGAVNEHQRETEDEFAHMLGYFVGRGQVVATPQLAATKSDFVLRDLATMRVIRDSREIYLSVLGFQEYCAHVSKSPHKFRQALARAGCFHLDSLVVAGDRNDVAPISFALGQGIPGLPLGAQKCYRLDFEKAMGPISLEARVVDATDNVIRMRGK